MRNETTSFSRDILYRINFIIQIANIFTFRIFCCCVVDHNFIFFNLYKRCKQTCMRKTGHLKSPVHVRVMAVFSVLKCGVGTYFTFDYVWIMDQAFKWHSKLELCLVLVNYADMDYYVIYEHLISPGYHRSRLACPTSGIVSLTLSLSQWINRTLLLSTYNFISPIAKTLSSSRGLAVKTREPADCIFPLFE